MIYPTQFRLQFYFEYNFLKQNLFSQIFTNCCGFKRFTLHSLKDVKRFENLEFFPNNRIYYIVQKIKKFFLENDFEL